MSNEGPKEKVLKSSPESSCQDDAAQRNLPISPSCFEAAESRKNKVVLRSATSVRILYRDGSAGRGAEFAYRGPAADDEIKRRVRDEGRTENRCL